LDAHAVRCSRRALRDAEKLDPVAKFRRRLKIGERDRLDTLNGDRGRIDHRAKGKGCQDRELMRRVETADVETRIGFRIAELLRLAQTVAKDSASCSIRVRM